MNTSFKLFMLRLNIKRNEKYQTENLSAIHWKITINNGMFICGAKDGK